MLLGVKKNSTLLRSYFGKTVVKQCLDLTKALIENYHRRQDLVPENN